jgi:hypothetical protein
MQQWPAETSGSHDVTGGHRSSDHHLLSRGRHLDRLSVQEEPRRQIDAKDLVVECGLPEDGTLSLCGEGDEALVARDLGGDRSGRQDLLEAANLDQRTAGAMSDPPFV